MRAQKLALTLCVSILTTRAALASPPPGDGYAAIRAGATYRRLTDIPVYGVDLGVSLGRWDERGADLISLEPFFGRTEHGLTTRAWALRYRTDWLFGRAFAGLSVGVGVLSVTRATSGEPMTSAGLLLGLYGGCDVLRFEHGALGLEIALNADSYGVGFWGPSAALAYRF